MVVRDRAWRLEGPGVACGFLAGDGEGFLRRMWHWGRPRKDRVALAKALVAKMVYSGSTTRELM